MGILKEAFISEKVMIKREEEEKEKKMQKLKECMTELSLILEKELEGFPFNVIYNDKEQLIYILINCKQGFKICHDYDSFKIYLVKNNVEFLTEIPFKDNYHYNYKAEILSFIGRNLAIQFLDKINV